MQTNFDTLRKIDIKVMNCIHHITATSLNINRNKHTLKSHPPFMQRLKNRNINQKLDFVR